MKRRAFTLVELLVALVIIVLLMGLVLAFMPKREVVITRDAAGQIESYISGAKARALREQRAVSVQFMSNDGNQTFYGLQMLDTGSDWMPTPANGVYLDLPEGWLITQPSQNVARQVGAPLQGNVVVGDMLVIHETTPPTAHKIVAVNYTTNTVTLAGTQITIDDGMGGTRQWVDGIPAVNQIAPTRLTHNYKYIRQPRPFLGEQPLQLPKDVFIRGVTNVVPTSRNLTPGRSGQFELTFAPSGDLVGAAGTVVLWISDTNNAAKPILVAIYPTGGLKSHDVGPPGNEFQFVRDGR